MDELQFDQKNKVIVLFNVHAYSDVSDRATYEAMLTFMRLRLERPNPEQVAVPTYVIIDPDRLFHFARIIPECFIELVYRKNGSAAGN